MWSWWILGFILLFFVIILYSRRNKNRAVEKTRESPLNILKQRYAKGKITEEEFEKQKETLKEKN
ncbi:SHOCT domain-containing protein [Salegentibacter sp. LM13S]|uniref:SHOCT domain-containing protein n=1 Tax=Salegentibacter lacus TaxID=2873599 RepID=UPI001CCC4FF3|nr:SHOCT domain-containing protein [Salegentibacter lacus]MBZ9632479.1 SHOCT domain-containing protein [Salegentibacter lacus]